MIEALIIFGASFLIVFLLAIQSKNTNASRYLAAAITAVGIAACNYALIKLISVTDWRLFGYYASGSALGVMSGIFAYDKLMTKKKVCKCKTP